MYNYPNNTTPQYNSGYIDLPSVAGRLIDLRANLNYTREQVCYLLQTKFEITLSPSGLWKYENAKIINLNMNTISALATLYGVYPKYILYGDISVTQEISEAIVRKQIEIIKLILSVQDLNCLNIIHGHAQQNAVASKDETKNNFEVYSYK